MAVIPPLLRAAAPALLIALVAVPLPGAAKDRPVPGLRLSDSGHTTISRDVVLGLNKSVLIDLPVDAADILIADPEIADLVVRSSRRLFILGRKVGQTNAFLFDAAGERIGLLDIRVEPDIKALEDGLARYLPDARIAVESMNETLILSGGVASASDADFAITLAGQVVGDPAKVINRLTIEEQEQVLLRVRVLEMQRTVLKQLGVDVAALIGTGNVVFDIASVNPFSLNGRAIGGLGPGATTGTSFLWSDGSDAVGAVLQAFERNGYVRTLAEPNLTAISGEPASFLAGGEYPVPTSRDRDGNVTVTFKPFGVGLGFTPVVLSGGRISMRISTEVSELTSEGAFLINGGGGIDGLSIPALSVRRAETTVELPSGGSLVIAGLIEESLKETLDGVPGLKSIPVLGSLFRSRDFQNAETELIVIVTPFLVDPVAEQEIATPADGFVPMSDLDAFVRGQLNAQYGEADTDEAMSGFKMDEIGFILE